MARIREEQLLVPSILDRLIDEEPERKVEPSKSRAQVLRDMKRSVRRDLENLLNTRWRAQGWPEDLPELETSLVNYGIPDFTGATMSQPSERARLRSTIERVIQRFEPRFKSVKVTLLENQGEMSRTLRFKIEALMHAEPAPEPVVFDSQLEPSSASFQVNMGVS